MKKLPRLLDELADALVRALPEYRYHDDSDAGTEERSQPIYWWMGVEMSNDRIPEELKRLVGIVRNLYPDSIIVSDTNGSCANMKFVLDVGNGKVVIRNSHNKVAFISPVR